MAWLVPIMKTAIPLLITWVIRIGPDRANPLHFTHPQFAAAAGAAAAGAAAAVVLCCITFKEWNYDGMESVSFTFLGPIL